LKDFWEDAWMFGKELFIRHLDIELDMLLTQLGSLHPQPLPPKQQLSKIVVVLGKGPYSTYCAYASFQPFSQTIGNFKISNYHYPHVSRVQKDVTFDFNSLIFIFHTMKFVLFSCPIIIV
jgi:hypothetical protein